ncbi:histidine kinase [Brevundimonas sp.]|uniref:sensor histidine kinase n=1 Tax=Brevundimonas sp. TaxID=1871086 RepID=UPI0025BB562E|nr:histidine kinase [Brevundimonas sp.]
MAENATRRTFAVRPDFREAFWLTAFLWCGVLGFLNVASILGGTVSTVGEYLTIILAPVFAVTIAGVLFLAFWLMAGRNVLIAWPAVGIAALVAAALMTGADFGSQWVLHHIFDAHRMPDTSRMSVLIISALYLCIYTTNTALIWITSANRHMREQQHRIAVRDADNLRAELRALRLQLDPHFVINALNGVCVLIADRRYDHAERMIERLATFMRATQDYSPENTITLADEMELTEDYLAVEAERFGDRMVVAFHCDPDIASVRVPNLLLQPLVENAVKYGVNQSSTPVTVSIRAERLETDRIRLVVANDGGAAASELSGSGLGEGSTRSRLAISYGVDATFDAGPTASGYRVEITLPIRQAQSHAVSPPVGISRVLSPPVGISRVLA